MSKKSYKQKQKINCLDCNKLLIKPYISSYIKNQHSKTEYSQFVCQGMKYTMKDKNLIFIANDKYYCKVCKRIIKNKSLYMHNKSILHKKLLSFFF